MRAWLVALIAACAGPAKLAPNAGAVKLAGNIIVRVEGDGTTSVIAHAVHGGAKAFGFARTRDSLDSAAQSAQVHLALARAWQTLAASQPASAGEAMRNAARELAACGCDVDLAEEKLRFADDLVIRQERDEIVVLARAEYEGAAAAGVVRLRKTSFERAGPEFLREVARARAWQALSLMFGADTDRAFEAAWQGFLHARDCAHNDAPIRAGPVRTKFDAEPARRAEALTELHRILEASIRGCTRPHIESAW